MRRTRAGGRQSPRVAFRPTEFAARCCWASPRGRGARRYLRGGYPAGTGAGALRVVVARNAFAGGLSEVLFDLVYRFLFF